MKWFFTNIGIGLAATIFLMTFKIAGIAKWSWLFVFIPVIAGILLNILIIVFICLILKIPCFKFPKKEKTPKEEHKFLEDKSN